MNSSTSTLSGITAITGMTSFFQEASDMGKQSLLAVTPADMASLTRRADNTKIHAKRSVKVMKFGDAATAVAPAPEKKKKKQKIRAGSAQEEEALVKMVMLIMDCGDLVDEIGKLTLVLLAEEKREEAKSLQKQVRTHVECLEKTKNLLGEVCSEMKIPQVDDYSWLILPVC